MKVSILKFFFFVKHNLNLKIMWYMWILNIPNDCSANADHSYLFWASGTYILQHKSCTRPDQKQLYVRRILFIALLITYLEVSIRVWYGPFSGGEYMWVAIISTQVPSGSRWLLDVWVAEVRMLFSANVFVSSAKYVHLQNHKCSSAAQWTCLSSSWKGGLETSSKRTETREKVSIKLHFT